jgi:hypothetical protein
VSPKPECKDLDPKRWADLEERGRERRAVDEEGEALAECYRVLLEAGAIKSKGGDTA